MLRNSTWRPRKLFSRRCGSPMYSFIFSTSTDAHTDQTRTIGGSIVNKDPAPPPPPALLPPRNFLLRREQMAKNQRETKNQAEMNLGSPSARDILHFPNSLVSCKASESWKVPTKAWKAPTKVWKAFRWRRRATFRWRLRAFSSAVSLLVLGNFFLDSESTSFSSAV